MSMTTHERFGGLWSVRREIKDAHGGQTGAFRGLVRLRDDGDGLIYDEHGTLTLGQAKMQATRQYLWRPTGAGIVSVLFEDGRPFHRFDWHLTVSSDSHVCGEDSYTVRYSFGEESWQTRWQVRGPAKDYVATSIYLRPVAGDVAAGER